MQAQFPELCKRIQETSDSADELSEDRCDRRTRDTPAKYKNQKKVEPDIEYCGKEKKQERSDRIPKTSQKGTDEIVKQLRRMLPDDEDFIYLESELEKQLN